MSAPTDLSNIAHGRCEPCRDDVRKIHAKWRKLEGANRRFACDAGPSDAAMRKAKVALMATGTATTLPDGRRRTVNGSLQFIERIEWDWVKWERDEPAPDMGYQVKPKEIRALSDDGKAWFAALARNARGGGWRKPKPRNWFNPNHYLPATVIARLPAPEALPEQAEVTMRLPVAAQVAVSVESASAELDGVLEWRGFVTAESLRGASDALLDAMLAEESGSEHSEPSRKAPAVDSGASETSDEVRPTKTPGSPTRRRTARKATQPRETRKAA